MGLELKDFIVIGAYGYRHSIKEQEFECSGWTGDIIAVAS